MFKRKKDRLYSQHHVSIDAAQERKKRSANAWSMRSAAILLTIGIFGLAASSFAATPDSLDVNAFDPKKPAIAQAKGFNKKLKDKAPKYHKLHPNKASQDQDKSQDKAQIIHDIKERKEAIKAAIASNPTAVADAALPQEVKDALPEEVKGDVEQTKDLIGTWKTGHADPANGKTPQEMAVVQTADGINNYVYGSLPNINPGREVKVSGVVVDNFVAVAPATGVKVKVSGKVAASSGKNILSLASANKLRPRIALAQATYSPGLVAHYFASKDLTDNPILPSRQGISPFIDHNWGLNPPEANMPADNFSIEWTGVIHPTYKETVNFSTLSDDGVRLWVNNQLLIDDFTDHIPKVNTSTTVTLEAGSITPIKVQYYDAVANAEMHLYWSGTETQTIEGVDNYASDSQLPNQIVPDYVLEHQDGTTPDQNYTWSFCDDTSTSPELKCHPNNTAKDLSDNPIRPPIDANGGRHILVVPVRFAEDTLIAPVNPITQASYTPGELLKAVVGNPDSVAEFYRRNSSGLLKITAEGVPNWVTIPRPSPSTTCYDGRVLQPALHGLITGGQIPNATKATNIIYVFKGASCDHSSGYAVQFGTNAPGLIEESDIYLSDAAHALSLSMAHELGHNFGLNHAHTGHALGDTDYDEYGNKYDVMGQQVFTAIGDSSHLSAFHKWQLGFLSTGAGVQDVTTKGTYTLKALESTSGVRGIRIPVLYGSKQQKDDTSVISGAVFLEFRSPIPDSVFDSFKGNVITPGLLANYVQIPPPIPRNVSGNTYPAPSESGRFQASQTLLLPANGSSPLNAGMATGVTYRYKTDYQDVTHRDVCITPKSQTSSDITVDIDPMCGGTITTQQLDTELNIQDRISTHSNPGKVSSASGAAQAPISNATCIDPVAHQLYVGDWHRVLAYDLDPTTNKVIDEDPDHVLGADAVTDKYVFNGSPIEGINATNFSASWSGKITIPTTGEYKLQTYSDDGVRVYINGVKVIENWTDHSPTYNTMTTAPITQPGTYDIKVQYYQKQGGSTMQLLWMTPGSTTFTTVPESAFPGGLYGSYFNNISLYTTIGGTGTNLMVNRVDRNIDNPWGFNPNGRAPTYADKLGSTVSQNSISYDTLKLACDPKHHRLFVAQTGSSINGPSAAPNRISVFDLTNGITNGMNAAYVLGQPDFTSANTAYGKTNFWQANTFSVSDIAYSDTQNTLFVAQVYPIPRVLGFEFGSNNDKLTNNMNAAYAIGRPDGDFTNLPVTNAENSFGAPISIAVDDVRNRLFWASSSQALVYGNAGSFLTTFPLPTAASPGVKAHWRTYSSMIKLDKVVNSIPPPLPGSMVVSGDGNSLYAMPAGAASSASTSASGLPLRVYDISNMPVGLNVSAPIVVPKKSQTLLGYTLADQIAFDPQNNLMYVPNRGSGTVHSYNILGKTDTSFKPPATDPYPAATLFK